MTLRRRLIRLFDRPGGRKLLGLVAGWHARGTSGTDIELFFDQVWLHSARGIYWGDAKRFTYNKHTPKKWLRKARQAAEDVDEFWFYYYQPSPGDTIVDVGAGDGTDIPRFSDAVGRTGTVLAIEAHPETYQLLERMVYWNRLRNVTCIQNAVVDQPREVTITSGDRHISNAVRLDVGNEASEVVVDGRTLDDICQQAGIEAIDFLKVNIEGAERYAIQGMRSMLERTRFVCIACHDFRAHRGEGDQFRTKASVVAFLCDKGWHVVTRDEHADPSVRDHVHAWNAARVGEVAHGDSDLAEMA